MWTLLRRGVLWLVSTVARTAVREIVVRNFNDASLWLRTLWDMCWNLILSVF